MPHHTYTGWQAVCTHAVSLESQRGSGDAGCPLSKECMWKWFCWAVAGGYLSHPGGTSRWKHHSHPFVPARLPRVQAEAVALGARTPARWIIIRGGKTILWCSANCRQHFSWCSGCWILKLFWKNNLPSICKAVSLRSCQAVILSASPGCCFLR